MRSSLARWPVSARAASASCSRAARSSDGRRRPSRSRRSSSRSSPRRGARRRPVRRSTPPASGHAEHGVRCSRPSRRARKHRRMRKRQRAQEPRRMREALRRAGACLSGFVEIVHAASIANRTSVPLSARSLHAVCRRETDRGRRFAERTADESGRERHGIPLSAIRCGNMPRTRMDASHDTSSAVLLLHGDVAGVDGYAVGSVEWEDRLRHVHVRCGPCGRSAFVHRARKAGVRTVRRRGAQHVPERLFRALVAHGNAEPDALPRVPVQTVRVVIIDRKRRKSDVGSMTS